ncbi:MAG: multi-sensor hybrid histidine kinase [Deltaproteobacteria bacterium]|nr:multi-sensor hybrid histidine kinase [Deltaproteobacteria bacterium]
MMRFSILLVSLLLLLVCRTPSFGEPHPGQSVRIGAFNLYPAIFKAENGTIQGFYVDFLAEIAKREGWHIEYVYGNWADGLARIKSGEVDALTSVTWTQERTAYMDYGTVPLLTVWSELYVDEKSSIDSIRQVEGKKIAVMKGDTNGANFRNLVEKFVINCQIVEYGNFDEIFKAISSRQVDGGVVSNIFGAATQHKYSVKSSGVIFNPFDIFFAVAKGKNRKIIETLDRYLSDWRANENSPYHLARQRWSHGDSAAIHVIPRWLTKTLAALAIASGAAAIFIILLRTQVRRKTAELIAQAAERKKIEETLFFINESGLKYREDELLAALTAHLASCLGVECAFVSQFLPEKNRLRTRGLYAMGARARDIEYDVSGTPCANVINKELCFYASDVVRLFPEDRLLVDMGAEGYAGSPLWDSHGNGIGLVGIISQHPLQNRALLETILQIVGTRAAQELEAISYLEKLKLKNFIIENIKDAAYLVSPDGKCREVNEAASIMLGYTREELLSMSVSELTPNFPAEDWPAHWEELKQKGNLQFEGAHRTKDGRDIPVEIKANYCKYGDLEFNCGIVRDISERKKAEREMQTLMVQLNQSQKMESVGRLAGGIAHDFNNLLTPILGYSEMLKSAIPADSPDRKKVESIIKAADKARILTQQLLSFGRKQILEMKTVDINEVVTSFQSILLRTIRENIVIKLHLTTEICGIRADRNQLEQIIMNLVVNAQDSIKDNGIITIETAPVTLDEEYVRQHVDVTPGNYLLLAVTDSGCGMDEETLSHLFEPFFTTKAVGEGTGLGLATVYGLVKQHNGHIWVCSEVGRGTAFKMYFPIVAGKPAVDAVKASEQTAIDAAGCTVMLVEDDEMVRTLVSELLLDHGFTVLVEENPQQALKISEGQQIDLLVTDVVMPDMNGPELHQRLLKSHPGMKVLYMSGYTNNAIVHHGVLDAGINFIQKPFAINDLAKKIDDVLNGPLNR